MALSRQWLAAVVFGLIGYALNLLAVPLLPGLQLLFGAVPAFVIALVFGPGPGALAGGLAGLRSITLWGHPYGWILLVLESAAVGLLRQRMRPAFAAGAFWLVAGLWLGLLAYGVLLGVPWFESVIAILKQVLNGIVNGLLAEALMLAVPVRRALRLQSRPTVRQYLSVLAALSSAVPLLALWILGTRQQADAAVATAETEARIPAVLLARVVEGEPAGRLPDRATTAALVIQPLKLRIRRPDGLVLRAQPTGAWQVEPGGDHTEGADAVRRLLAQGDVGTGSYTRAEAPTIPFMTTYERALVHVERVGRTGWVVWSENSFRHILAPLSRRILVGELVMIAALLAALLLAIVVARRLEAPIQALVDATERLAAGDLRARVGAQAHLGPAEPVLLAERLDAMAQRIEQVEEERARLLESERVARAEAELRAQEEAALREATQAVTTTFTVKEVMHQIAQSALTATRADGAYVERIDADRRVIHVAAVAGEVHPPAGDELPLDGSYVQAVVEDGAPILIPRLADATRPLAAGMSEKWPDAAAIVLPLLDSGSAIGGLLLVRAGTGGFAAHELKRASTFASLAALAFRKVHLLEESEMRRDEVERLMESRARMIRGFSHDVKNPLGAADGYLQLLQDGILGELTAKQVESIGRVRSSVHAALELIEELVELARAEAGQLEVKPHPVDPRDVVREMTGEYRAQAQSAGLTLEKEFLPGVGLIRSDDRRIRQVLGNLLSNAVKYTPEGGHITVRVGVRERPGGKPEGSWVAIDVEDTGRGIPPERRDRIFREFSRLEPGRTPGAGLGLAISRRVARAISGDLTFVSEPGKGSTFTLWLPLEWDGKGG